MRHGIFADDEEGSGNLPALQDIENLRGPFGIGAVIKAQCDQTLLVTGTTNDIGRGERMILLIDYQPLLVLDERAAAIDR